MDEKQFVIFKLNQEIYAVDIENVGGITEFTEITKLPNVPKYIEGVINLRGEIIPVVNLKNRFGLCNTDIKVEEEKRIILYQINGKNIGFIVDDASQVVKLSLSMIEEAPTMINGVQHEYINGIGNMNGQIVIIINLERILSENEKNKVISSKL